jgi:hypothetical protein
MSIAQLLIEVSITFIQLLKLKLTNFEYINICVELIVKMLLKDAMNFSSLLFLFVDSFFFLVRLLFFLLYVRSDLVLRLNYLSRK